MKYHLCALGAAALASAPALGQAADTAVGRTVAELKAEADLAKVLADTKKADLDAVKARLEIDKARLEPIKSLTGGSASVTGGEKTAEAMLLGQAALAGASAKLVAVLVASKVPFSAKPYVVFGDTPPKVTQWRSFAIERESVGKSLDKAIRDWSKAEKAIAAARKRRPADPLKNAVLGAVGAASTVLPLLKTETTIVGADIAFPAGQPLQAVLMALSRAGYASDFAEFETVDAKLAHDELMAPLAARRTQADAFYQAFEKDHAGSDIEDVRTAGRNLRVALDAYKALSDRLMGDSAGLPLAVVIKRQQTFADEAAGRPLVYVTASDAAYTSTTTKNLWSAMFGAPAYGTAAVTFDYAIVWPGANRRGSLTCMIAKRRMTAARALRSEDFAAKATALCDPPGTPRKPGSPF